MFIHISGRGFVMGKYFKIAKIFNFMLASRIKITGKKVDSNTHYMVVKRWAQYTLDTIGADVETIGLENIPECNCLFVSNHQSYIDIPIILSQIDKPIGFIAKKQLENVPLMSFWMKKIHCVFLNRESVREAIESINEGVKILENFSSMVIFPEGTRSRGDNMGEFKKGSIKLGLKASVPIVPVTICGSYRAYEQSGTFKPCKIKLIIGEPIYTDKLGKDEKKNLSDLIKASIEKNYCLPE